MPVWVYQPTPKIWITAGWINTECMFTLLVVAEDRYFDREDPALLEAVIPIVHSYVYLEFYNFWCRSISEVVLPPLPISTY